MSTIITTNNLSYTATQLVDTYGPAIIRQPTEPSTDTFPTAEDIIIAFLGTIDPNYTGNNFIVTIVNDSPYIITQNNIDSTLVFVPHTTSITIAPKHIVAFTFIQTSASPPSVAVCAISRGTIFEPNN